MKTFLTKSMDSGVSDKELETQGCRVTSLLSFERAITETNQLKGITNKVKGYEVTEQGIIIIWD